MLELGECVLLVTTSLALLSAGSLIGASEEGRSSTGDTQPIQTEPRKQLELKDSDWQPTHYKLYDNDVIYFPPDTVYELLEELEKIYEPFTNEQTNRRKWRIDRLLRTKRLDKRTCTPEDLEDFLDTMDYNKPFWAPLHVYLQTNYADYLVMCEDKVIQRLRDSVQSVAEDHWADINLMTRIAAKQRIYNGKEIGDDNIGKIYLFPKQLNKALMEFLVKRSENTLDEIVSIQKKGSWTRFYNFFFEHVVETCLEWKEIKEGLDLFLDSDEKLVKKMTEDDVKWLRYGYFCHYIYDQRKEISKKLYKMLWQKLSWRTRLWLILRKRAEEQTGKGATQMSELISPGPIEQVEGKPEGIHSDTHLAES